MMAFLEKFDPVLLGVMVVAIILVGISISTSSLSFEPLVQELNMTANIPN